MAEKGGEGGEERRGVRGKGGIGEGPAGGVLEWQPESMKESLES